MAKKNNNAMQVTTGKDTRWSYANVWEPKSINGGDAKYSISLIIPKSDVITIEKIRAAIKAAYEEGKFKLGGSKGNVPPLERLKTPLRDGDLEKDDEAYKNSYFVNATTKIAPRIVDASKQDIIDTKSTAERPSTSTPSTRMATRESPADSRHFRRSETVSRSAAESTLTMSSMIWTRTRTSWAKASMTEGGHPPLSGKGYDNV